MNLHFHIEKLVIDGANLSARDRLRLQAALETELAQLIQTNGLPQSVSLPSCLHLDAAANPQILGQQIARSIYSGLVPEHNFGNDS